MMDREGRADGREMRRERGISVRTRRETPETQIYVRAELAYR